VRERITELMPEVNRLTRESLEKYEKERSAPPKREDNSKP
jgi:hypothetical protein